MAHKLITFLSLVTLSTGAFALDTAPRALTGKDVAQSVAQELVKEGAGDEVRVQINGVRDEDLITEGNGALITASVDSLTFDRARSRWEATLLMLSAGKNLAPVKISGRYDEMAHVPTLKSRMQTGDIITEDDIVWEDVPAARFRKSVITDSAALIGKSPKRVVSAGRPIRLDEITGPTVISKGSQVTLVYRTPSIEIKTLGEAMENGAAGSVIRVKNTSSKAILQGTVEGEGRVRISPPENMSAGLM